jgi:hypothetical protein
MKIKKKLMWDRDNRIRFIVCLFTFIEINYWQAHYDITNNNKKVNFELEGFNFS